MATETDRQKMLRQQGNCSGLSLTEADRYFFLGRGGSPIRTRQRFCDSCPVRMECWEYAVVHQEEGIWGGTTDSERQIAGRILRPSLVDKARREGWLEERPKEPSVPSPSSQDATEFQIPQEILDDIDLNTYLQTGS